MKLRCKKCNTECELFKLIYLKWLICVRCFDELRKDATNKVW